MDMRQLEAFVKVVELQSFSKAAKSLYVTQPTISTHVVSLEKELDVRLLDRTTKTVNITSVGEKLYGYAKKILDLREKLYQEFDGECKLSEKIKIAGSTIPSQYILPELISAFQKQNNNIYFSINQGDSLYVMDEILKHRVDIGFVGMKGDNDRLHYIPFYEDNLVIITPNEKYYKELLQTKNVIQRLLKEPMVLREKGSGTNKSAEKFIESMNLNIEQLNIVARINDQGIIKRSVSKGMGISIMSKKAVLDYIEDSKILMYEPEEEQITRSLYIVFEKYKNLTRLERCFIEFCRQFYKITPTGPGLWGRTPDNSETIQITYNRK